MGTSRRPCGFTVLPSCISGACATHAQGRAAGEGAWECLWRVSLSHREGRLCGLFVPSLPSVSLLFSSWPAGQESFVEGTRKKIRPDVFGHTTPVDIQTPAHSRGRTGGLAPGGE